MIEKFLFPYQPISGDELLSKNVRGVPDFRYRSDDAWKAVAERAPAWYCRFCHPTRRHPGFVFDPILENEGRRRMVAGVPPILALEAFSCRHYHVINAERALVLANISAAQIKRRRVRKIIILLICAVIGAFSGFGLFIGGFFAVWLFMCAWEWRKGEVPDWMQLAAELNQHPEYPGIAVPNKPEFDWFERWSVNRVLPNLCAQPWLDPQWQLQANLQPLPGTGLRSEAS